MLIISKFAKSISGRTKCLRGLRVWDLCRWSGTPGLPRLPFELPTEEVIKANCSLSAPLSIWPKNRFPRHFWSRHFDFRLSHQAHSSDAVPSDLAEFHVVALVWPLHRSYCLATTTFFLDIYLLRLKVHCNGLITIILSVTVFINDFLLTFRREKKYWIK